MRENRILKHYRNYFFSPNDLVLDCGCATGKFLEAQPEQTIGIDIDKQKIKVCKEKGLNAQQIDLEKKLGFEKNYFDGVFASHVIEHTHDPIKSLKEIHRVLKPNGKIVVFTPNINKFKKFWTDPTHKIPFTKPKLEKALVDSGFAEIKTIASPKSVKGQSWVVEKGIINIKTLFWIYKISGKIGINGSDIIMTARTKK